MSDQTETYDTIFGCSTLILIGGNIATFFMYGMKAGVVAVLISIVLLSIACIVDSILKRNTVKKEKLDIICGAGILIIIVEIIAAFLIYGWRAGVPAVVIFFIALCIIGIIEEKNLSEEKKLSYQAVAVSLNVLLLGILLLLINEWLREGLCDWFSWLSQHFT